MNLIIQLSRKLEWLAQTRADLRAGMLASPETITIRQVAGDKYDRIVDYRLGQIPEAKLEEVPF